MSVYNGELTARCVVENLKKLKQAFPSLPAGFYEVLSERLKAKGFSDQRLTDAINHVIDNHVYPTPSIAEFVSYDKKIKLLTYNDMTKKVNEMGRAAWSHYGQIRVSWHDKPLWADRAELDKYGIKYKTN